MKDTEKFLQEISRIKDINYLVALTKLLGVEIDNPNKTPRPFEDVLQELCANYSMKPRHKRRELTRLLHKANKIKPDKDPIENPQIQKPQETQIKAPSKENSDDSTSL